MTKQNTEPTDPNPAPQEPGQTPPKPTPTPAPPPAPAKEPEWDGKFTPEQQEYLDKQFKQRGEQYVNTFVKELGYDDEDAIKAAVKDHEDRKRDELTELEKAQTDLADEKKKREAAEASKAATERESKIVSAASGMNFADPSDAIALVGDTEDIEEALKKLAEDKPYLIKQKTGANQHAVKTSFQNQQETREQKRERTFGRGVVDDFNR